MIKNYLSSIQDVGIYGVLAILIFFFVFTAVLFYVIFMRKELVKELSEAPLQDSLSSNNHSTTQNPTL